MRLWASHQRHRRSAKRQHQAFLDHLGTGCALADQHALARSADVSALLSAQDAAMRSTGLRFTRPGFPAVPFGPIADAQTCPVGSSYAAHLGPRREPRTGADRLDPGRDERIHRCNTRRS